MFNRQIAQVHVWFGRPEFRESRRKSLGHANLLDKPPVVFPHISHFVLFFLILFLFAMAILTSVKDYIKRHRRGLLVTATVAGGTYLAGRYASNKLREFQEKSTSERMAKEK